MITTHQLLEVLAEARWRIKKQAQQIALLKLGMRLAESDNRQLAAENRRLLDDYHIAKGEAQAAEQRAAQAESRAIHWYNRANPTP